MPRKRRISPFSLSFLDIMACGFGAVTLLFLILKHDVSPVETADPNLSAEVDLLQEDIRVGQQELVKLRNSLARIEDQTVEAQGLSQRIVKRIEEIRRELSAQEDPEQQIETLRKQVEELKEEVSTLEEQSRDEDVRKFVGQGDRQYLTGLKLGGRNVLILLDTSASMLAEDIVNVVIRRNRSDDIKRQSEKWRRAVRTVEWLVAQMPPQTNIQVYAFNTKPFPVLKDSGQQWIAATDTEQIDKLFAELNLLAPNEGTSLINAFDVISQLKPRPDNLFLLTDGLPTVDDEPAKKTTISGRDREKLFKKAVKALPKGLPVNVVLFPFEGDPRAAASYWKLALASQGSFLSPSRDWP